MALLMGAPEKRHTQHVRERPGLGAAGQKAGHIGPLHRAGGGAGADGGQVFQHAGLPQNRNLPGQPADMLIEGVALAQSKPSLRHLQQASRIQPGAVAAVNGGRGGVIAGIQPERSSHSPHSPRTKEPRIPLIKETTLSSS